MGGIGRANGRAFRATGLDGNQPHGVGCRGATAPELEGRGGIYLYDCQIAEVNDDAAVLGAQRAGGEHEAVLVRVHSQCVTGDIFGSMRCDCGDQLAHALQQIEKENLYLKESIHLLSNQ